MSASGSPVPAPGSVFRLKPAPQQEAVDAVKSASSSSSAPAQGIVFRFNPPPQQKVVDAAKPPSGSPVPAPGSVFRLKPVPQQGAVDAVKSAAPGSSTPAACSVFRFKPAPKEEQRVARKCIVCGTTRHESKMKPFMIRGEQLNVWTNNYFGIKRTQLTNFYSKLRYTINPYACVEHFAATPVAYPMLTKVGKRTCGDLLEPDEEPPSIKSITEKKPSPPPEDPPEPRAQQEVVDAVMTILKNAKEEMDKEEARRKILRKIARKVMNMHSEAGDGEEAEDGVATVSPEKLDPKKKKEERKKRKREKGSEKAAAPDGEDGSDAETDHSDHSIDVTGISSDEGDDGSTDSSSDEDDVMNEVEVISASKQQKASSSRMQTPYATACLMAKLPPPTVIMPRMGMRPSKTGYRRITTPLVAKPTTAGTPGKPAQPVPKRLTPAATGNPSLSHRPSWVMPNPGQLTLASVLQKYWNENSDGQSKQTPYMYRGREFHRKPRPPPPGLHGTPGRPRYVIPDVLPGSRTKFLPASISAPLLNKTPSPSKEGGEGEVWEPPIRNPLIRTAALQNNPPLSPSRLIVGCEEVVETTPTDEQLRKEELLHERSLSSSASEESEEESDLDVCSETQQRAPPVLGHPIEGVLERAARSRTTTVRTFSGSELESLSDEEAETEVDVETVDAASVQASVSSSGRRRKRRDCEEDDPVDIFTEVPYPPQPSDALLRYLEKRKMKICTTREGIIYRPSHAVTTKKSIILPPSAIVKPPTKLLSAGQISMKEALHAQARAAAGMPVRIDTTGLLRTIKKPSGWDARHLEARKKRLADMPKLAKEAKADGRPQQSEFARLSAVWQQKLAEQKAAKAEEKKKRLQMMIDAQLMDEHPPPVLKAAVVAKDTASRPDRKGDDTEGFRANSLVEGSATRRSKVLRVRFHKKAAASVDVSKLKVLDRSTRPQAVVRIEEVATPSEVVDVEDEDTVDAPQPVAIPEQSRVKKVHNDAPPFLDESQLKKETRDKEEKKKEAVVVNPLPARSSLVIVKEELLALQEQLAAQAEAAAAAANKPPPTPVVGIPDEKKLAERREMFEKKREEIAYAKSGRRRRPRKEAGGEPNTVVARPVEPPVGMTTRRKSKAERAEEAEAAARRTQEMEGMMMLSDIDEDDDEVETVDEGKEKEKVNEESLNQDDSCRRSNRLQEKRRSGRRPIWLAITDEEAEEQQATGVRKRGRPRKGTTAPPTAPPPAKKSKMEKEVLSRVLPSAESATESVEKAKEGEEPKEMEEGSGNMEPEPAVAEAVDKDPEPTAAATVTPKKTDRPVKQPPKYTSPITHNDGRYRENDGRYRDLSIAFEKLGSASNTTATPNKPSLRPPRQPWMWTSKHNTTKEKECGGRLCNFCVKQQHRYTWIPNEATELLDHARTHCVETLMCPHKDCTHMNTTRKRITRHMNYVHKKFGTAIDLAEVYPSMRQSLSMRLRQCFPLLPELAVCQICRVAVVPDKSHLRWHAQAHLATRVWECSEAACTEKFATEEDCVDHIRVANCHGTVLNGLTEEQAEEVAKLVDRCFGKSLVRPQQKHLQGDVGSAKRDDEGESATAPTLAAQMEVVEVEEESEKAGPSR